MGGSPTFFLPRVRSLARLGGLKIDPFADIPDWQWELIQQAGPAAASDKITQQQIANKTVDQKNLFSYLSDLTGDKAQAKKSILAMVTDALSKGHKVDIAPEIFND